MLIILFSSQSNFFKQQNNYKKYPKLVGLNEIYIESKHYNEYEKRMKEGSEKAGKKQIVNFQKITPLLSDYLKVKSSTKPHYSMLNDDLFYHFARHGRLIDLPQLRIESHRFSGRERPIVIYEYDPHTETIFVGPGNHSMEKFKVEELEYYNLTVTDGGKSYSAYILDHHFVPEMYPVIFSTKEGSPDKKVTGDQSNNFKYELMMEKLDMIGLEMNKNNRESNAMMVEMKEDNNGKNDMMVEMMGSMKTILNILLLICALLILLAVLIKILGKARQPFVQQQVEHHSHSSI